MDEIGVPVYYVYQIAQQKMAKLYLPWIIPFSLRISFLC